MQRPFDLAVLDAIVTSAKLESAREEHLDALRHRALEKLRPTAFPVHVKSRGPHPQYESRQPVPDALVPWDRPWKEYAPTEFEAEIVRDRARAPGELATWGIKWESGDRWADAHNVRHSAVRKEVEERRTWATTRDISYEFGEKPPAIRDAVEFDEAGRPRNPRGRTGLSLSLIHI